MSNTNEPNRPSEASKAPSSPAEVGQGLVEQLLDHAKTLATFTPVTGTRSAELLTRSADTITAQSRLLALAINTLEQAADLFGCAESGAHREGRALVNATIADIQDAAQAEYQDTGVVPCPECERVRVQLAGCGATALGYGENCKPGDYGYSASLGDVQRLHTEVKGLRAERDALRRQLAEAQAGFKRWRERCIEARAERDGAQADNAALIEALIRHGGHSMDCPNGPKNVAEGREPQECSCGWMAAVNAPHTGAQLLGELTRYKGFTVNLLGEALDHHEANAEMGSSLNLYYQNLHGKASDLRQALMAISDLMPPTLPAPLPNLPIAWEADQRLLYKAVTTARDAIRNREGR